MSLLPTPGLAVRLSVAAMVAFWVLISWGGVVNPGYNHYTQFVSSLAVDGSQAPWLGTAAIAMLSVVCLTASTVIGRVAQACGRWLVVAGFSILIAGFFRISCPPDAAHCAALGGGGVSWTEAVHELAVVGFAAAMLLAMAAYAGTGVRSHRIGAGTVLGALAVVFLLLATGLRDLPDEAEQRYWVGLGQIWLVIALVEARGRVNARERLERLGAARRVARGRVPQEGTPCGRPSPGTDTASP